MNVATLFFYDNSEYLLTDFIDEPKFRFEGMELKKTSMSTFLDILSNYDKIQDVIKDIIDYFEKNYNEDNAIIKMQDSLSNINQIFKIFNIEVELQNYILHKQKLHKISTNNTENLKQYFKDFLIDYQSNIENIKKSIDTYYNINNDKLLFNLSPNKRIFYLKSKEIALIKSLIAPKSKQFTCIEYKNHLLPAESFIYKVNDINNTLDLMELEKLYNDTSKNDKIYQYILNHKVYNVTVYELNNFWEFLNAYYYYLTANNIHINKCKNCNKYFIPTNKINETLCDNIYKNR